MQNKPNNTKNTSGTTIGNLSNGNTCSSGNIHSNLNQNNPQTQTQTQHEKSVANYNELVEDKEIMISAKQYKK